MVKKINVECRSSESGAVHTAYLAPHGLTGRGPSMAHALVDLARQLREQYTMASAPHLPLAIDDSARVTP